MRIIAGIAKNRKIKAPKGHHTRPITDMIKEALFNVLNTRVNKANFLDMFAGSGSVGIEALSRGAELVIFIDNDKEAIKIIKDNLAHCNFTTNFEVYKNDVFKAINILKTRQIVFDIIYIDPPFDKTELFTEVILCIDNEKSLIKQDGVVIIRTPNKFVLPEEYSNLMKYRHNKYGESALHYYVIKS
ncbi:MAG: 16S rRNA (guanine(966)-N(2))-methyltransferase RsmD [Syntrophomonadaceae bacterium]|nr:16S rRNA (guanine(966)-N(2))-methyltransferase RsmD [Syntrophomonadaceae bacterium]